MKLLSKEALVLGGVYGVIDAPFSIIGLEFVTDILFIVFIVCAIMLCFNKNPLFLTKIMTDYPKTSYYLSSIGWIPYLTWVIVLGLVVSFYYFGLSAIQLKQQLWFLGVFDIGVAILSLVIAAIRTQRNK